MQRRSWGRMRRPMAVRTCTSQSLTATQCQPTSIPSRACLTHRLSVSTRCVFVVISIFNMRLCSGLKRHVASMLDPVCDIRCILHVPTCCVQSYVAALRQCLAELESDSASQTPLQRIGTLVHDLVSSFSCNESFVTMHLWTTIQKCPDRCESACICSACYEIYKAKFN